MSNKTDLQQQSLFPKSIDFANETFQSQEQSVTNFKPFQAIDNCFIESQEKTKISKARQLLDQTAKDIPDEQLETFAAQFKYVINCWLDSYEKQLFDGKTLQEISEI